MNKETIQNVVAAQRSYFDSGKTCELEGRVHMLETFRTVLHKYEGKMIDAARKDMGRSDVETYFMEIAMNLEELDFTLKHLKKWVRPEAVKTPTLFFMADSEIHPEPYGVTLIVSAWNYPFLQLFSPLIGTVSAGNTAILEPASDSPHSAALARKIVEEAFLPEHAVVLEGTSDITTLLLEEKLDYVFFTGSPRVGRIIQAAAAKHLTPVTLELGGKSPAIVDETADVDQAAKRIMWCKLFNAGQICVTVDHCYVHETVKEPFIESCKKWIAEFYGADPARRGQRKLTGDAGRAVRAGAADSHLLVARRAAPAAAEKRQTAGAVFLQPARRAARQAGAVDLEWRRHTQRLHEASDPLLPLHLAER